MKNTDELRGIVDSFVLQLTDLWRRQALEATGALVYTASAQVVHARFS